MRFRGYFAAGIGLLFALMPLATRAKSLDEILSRGTLAVCAHPNALPYSSRTANPPGFQLELAEALANRLGVRLATDWIIGPSQLRRADCDVVMDAIADPEAQDETHLVLSQPYYHTGVVLVVRPGSAIRNWQDLNNRPVRVGVLVSSAASVILGKQHVPISVFGFEDDTLEALQKGEIDAATINYTTASYYNLTHPKNPVVLVGFNDHESLLGWNVAVGMIHPDAKLRDAINAALAHLAQDGTIAKIYARYGITLQPPR
jgi:polar amino acid transport system substrate-binding protein